jgi:hypothetical protein
MSQVSVEVHSISSLNLEVRLTNKHTNYGHGSTQSRIFEQFMDPGGSYRPYSIYNSPPLVAILKQINLGHNLPFYFFKKLFNIT